MYEEESDDEFVQFIVSAIQREQPVITNLFGKNVFTVQYAGEEIVLDDGVVRQVESQIGCRLVIISDPMMDYAMPEELADRHGIPAPRKYLAEAITS